VTALTPSAPPVGANAIEGQVTFHVIGRSPTGSVVFDSGAIKAQVKSGVAQVPWKLPAGAAAGQYTIQARYQDGPNSRGALNYSSSTGSATLTVRAAAVQLQVSEVSTTYSTTKAKTLVLHAHVTSGGQPVTTGSVTFSVYKVGQVTGRLNANGDVV